MHKTYKTYKTYKIMMGGATVYPVGLRGVVWYGSGAQDVPLGYASFLMATVVCGARGRGACIRLIRPIRPIR